jgi:arylsulfatase B
MKGSLINSNQMKKIIYISFLIALLFFNGCSENKSENPGLPNIIIIVADDLGWNDVGFHGSDIATPYLDKLADKGMELGRFYTAPVCSPTRAGLLTGKYPDRFNLRNHVYSPRHKGGIPPEELFLPEMLKEAGYKRCAAFGKWHLGHSDYKYHPNNQGFTFFYGHYNGAIDYFTHKRDAELDWHRNNEPCFDEGYSTDLIAREAVKFINESSPNAPFFAYIAFNAPHSPMQAKEEELKLYGFDPNAENEDYAVVQGHKGERGMDFYGLTGRGNNLRQTYSAMVTCMDKWIGEIITATKEKSIEENTLIWFLSDNGGIYEFGGDNSPLRGAKHTEWEGGVRTVSLVKWPGVIAPGSKSEELIAYIDLFPTIEKIVTGEIRSQTDGIDIFPAFREEHLPDRYIFLGNTAIVSKKWKMNQDELFLIEQDHSEQNNLSDEYPDKVKELNSMINEFKKMQTGGAPNMQLESWNPPKNWTMPGE